MTRDQAMFTAGDFRPGARAWARDPQCQVAKRIGERRLGALGNWRANRLCAGTLRFLLIALKRPEVAVFEAKAQLRIVRSKRRDTSPVYDGETHRIPVLEIRRVARSFLRMKLP